MGLFDIISSFVHKAKQEAIKEYSIAAAVKENGVISGNKKKEAARKGWIGVDLDGTLAHMDSLSSLSKIGAPVAKMVELVLKLDREGYRIKIFTARASEPQQVSLIRQWLRDNGLPDFDVTNVKDFDMIRLYDDRAVQVIANTGELVSPPR